MSPEPRAQPGPDRVRLHITPFNADLFEKVIPANAKTTASNVSYHAVQTFPDRGFGFLELPKMEADKLKKKLNGSTLKGTKVRVEEAKTERKRKGRKEEGDAKAEDEEEKRARKKAKKEKKKREEGVIPGYELEEGRHVKRGWSEEKGEKGKKSKDSRDGKKLLFKAAVPSNAGPVEEKSKQKFKDKKEKKEKKQRKDGKTGKTVKEFSKSTKPVVDASVDEKASLTYEEGKGWVDEVGEVVEAEPPSKKRKRKRDEAGRAREAAATLEAEAALLRKQAAVEAAKPKSPEPGNKGDSSSSEDASESDSRSEAGDDSDGSSVSQAEDSAPVETTATTDKPSTPPPADSPREIHPLEALYKRKVSSTSDESKPKLNPIDTSFSFFNPDAEDEDVEVTQPALPPQTPHTKQDLEWRSLRSAAPTPDTAAIGKRFKFPFETADGEDEELDDEEMQDAIGGAAQDKSTDGQAREESEFRKWFYEKRGDNNRAWKKMRRDAKKQQRQRENRRLSRRVV